MTAALSWYRERVARLERQMERWQAVAEELRTERDDARTALAHMHATCMEQQAEIARLQAVERRWFTSDL